MAIYTISNKGWVVVPADSWDRIKPKAFADGSNQSELILNVAAVQLDQPQNLDDMAARLQNQVGKRSG